MENAAEAPSINRLRSEMVREVGFEVFGRRKLDGARLLERRMGGGHRRQGIRRTRGLPVGGLGFGDQRSCSFGELAQLLLLHRGSLSPPSAAARAASYAPLLGDRAR